MAHRLLRLGIVRLGRFAVVLAVASALGAGSVSAGPDAAGTPPVGAAPPRATAAVPPAVAPMLVALERAEQVRRDLLTKHAEVAAKSQRELGVIDALKRQKPSWRRDRELRSRLAASLEHATALDQLAQRLKRTEAEIFRARAAAIGAIDRALATSTGPERAELERRRRMWAPPRSTRRIVIPDDALDPLADPEELEQQAAALRDSEAELGGELARLELQVRRFDRMAAVRKQHDRAEQLDRRDDADPRRVAAHGGSGDVTAGDALPESDDAGAPPESDSPPGTIDEPSTGGGGELAAVLSDVVDPRTIDALRSAERSTDPAVRLAAARRARAAVVQRLELLKQRRAAIEGRARALRAGE